MAERDDLVFGDSLALARRSWVRALKEGLAQQGYPDYRRSDALAMRFFAAGSFSVGEFAQFTDTSRQASRRAIDTLVERGYLEIRIDDDDARRRLVHLTEEGRRYARAILTTVRSLNAEVTSAIAPEDLRNAVAVLTYVRDNIRW